MDPKIRNFVCFSSFKHVPAERGAQVYCNSYTSQACVHQAPGSWLLLGGCSAHLGQGDLEVRKKRNGMWTSDMLCFWYNVHIVVLVNLFLYIYYAEFLLSAIWTKKPIKYEYMMDLRENHFGEFFNCIFLSWKTQNICVLHWDLTDTFIYREWCF